MTQDKTPELKVAIKALEVNFKTAEDRQDETVWLLPIHAERILDYLTAEAQEQKGDKCEWCPECGCLRYKVNYNGERWCTNCGQIWFRDVDYTSAIRENLATFQRLKKDAKKPTPEPQGAEVAEAVKNVRSDMKDGRWPSKRDIETIIQSATRQQDGRVDALVKAADKYVNAPHDENAEEYAELLAALRAFKGE